MAISSKRISFGHIEIGELGRKYLDDALDRNWISEGPNVRLFEEKFASEFSYRHAIAVSSGTDAGTIAHAALLDLGAERGDEVITPALAFASTANCILAAGLKPVFVDAQLETLNIDPHQIEAAITPKTRAIQVVHTMGKICDMVAIMEIAKRNKLYVIEDCCEAHGATMNGQVVGTFGDMATFSFYAAHIICSGEGGMIVTERDQMADLCKSIRTHGRRDGELHFDFDRVGFNSKMNDLEAAIGLEGLAKFRENFRWRRYLRLRLDETLSLLNEDIILYRESPNEIMCPHAYAFVMRNSRERMQNLAVHLDKHGIESKVLFGSLPTQHKAFEFLGHQESDFPNAERIGRSGIQIGIHQYLSEEDVDYMAETIIAYFDGGA